MVEGHVGHPLSAVPDQGLRAYPLRDLPELSSGRRTATQDHPTILGINDSRSSAYRDKRVRRRTHNADSIEHLYSTLLTKTTKRCSRRSHSTPPNIVDVPTDLSTPFDYLTNSDTDAGQHRPVQRPSVGIVLQGYRMPQVLERLVLHLYETAGTPRECTDTHTGGTSRAGEGVESQDGLGEKRTEGAQACSGTEWYCVEQRVGCGGIEFSDEICYRLVREIVTFGNSGIEGGNAFMRAKDYSWTIGRSKPQETHSN